MHERPDPVAGARVSERAADGGGDHLTGPLDELSDRLAAAGFHAQLSVVGDWPTDSAERSVPEPDVRPVIFESESLLVRAAEPEYGDGSALDAVASLFGPVGDPEPSGSGGDVIAARRGRAGDDEPDHGAAVPADDSGSALVAGGATEAALPPR